ncbi:hypothetical protein Vretimale_4819 [Volvox reticuliferus]|uniref:Uncharacterized protein n=1 Tax=Volvox reticuliferus TaxID=1737510 RepID=A0A8J4G1X1_9CHLO|nr:hypothetical protein Vretimale_4819 [Volvox reticuliferus]
MVKYFNVTHALARGLARTFEDALALEPPPEPINIALAHKQHEIYNELLRSIVANFIELPADDSCPDCVFIEDTALVIGKTHAVVTRPGEVLIILLLFHGKLRCTCTPHSFPHPGRPGPVVPSASLLA